jgi:ribonucleoside-triphosphate reductase
MRSVAEIDAELAELRHQLATVKGTETEIYTRIVGYYRSLKNWNKGKREEYDHRQAFDAAEQMQGGRREGRPGERPPEDAPRRLATTTHAPSGTAAGTADATATATATATAAAHSPTAESTAVTYRYFYRAGCSGCGPVRQKLDALGLRGSAYDVDSEEGFAMAAHNEIMATPTVIFYGTDDEPLGRATSVHEIDAFASR